MNEMCFANCFFHMTFSLQLLVWLFMSQCLLAAVIPPYTKLDAYMRASQASGQKDMNDRYDRLANTLSELRDLDFGVKESWTAEDNKPSYKGCEPMKTGHRSVHCD